MEIPWKSHGNGGNLWKSHGNDGGNRNCSSEALLSEIRFDFWESFGSEWIQDKNKTVLQTATISVIIIPVISIPPGYNMAQYAGKCGENLRG